MGWMNIYIEISGDSLHLFGICICLVSRMRNEIPYFDYIFIEFGNFNYCIWMHLGIKVELIIYFHFNIK